MPVKPPVKRKSSGRTARNLRPRPALKVKPSAPDRPHHRPAAEEKPALTFPIVGIGASAGGLKALEAFLENLPADSNLALVVIIHLDPHRESLLADLLSRRTRMSVCQAKDNDVPEPGRMYVIPPNRILTLSHGRLRVSETTDRRDLHRPIDIFLSSLAAEQKMRAIGIILSGSGTDGTLGLSRIKSAGGLTMVQDASSSEFAGMPFSAMAAGLADYILPVNDMPAALLQYVRSAYYSHSGSEAGPQPEGSLQRILGLMRAKVGRDFRNYKAGTLLRRIRRRMSLIQVESLETYARFLDAHPEEIGKLFKDLLIGVTEFFRDPDAWEDLNKIVLPDLIRRLEEGRPLRAWVPGCASGREAYTLAMLCLEQFEALQRPARLQIFATDIDDRALETARAGLYDAEAVASVSPDRLARFFTQEAAGFRIIPELRDTMVFTSHNLLADPPFSHLDLIVCRNLLIYLEATVQQQIVQMFHFSLKDKGCLFLGSSETAGQQSGTFRLLSKKSRLYQKNGPSRMATPPALFLEPTVPKTEFPPEAYSRIAAPRPAPHFKPLAHFAQQALLEQFAPAAVLIDRHYRIHYYHGHTEKYLAQPQGEPTQDARLLAREGLAGRLRSAVRRCFETGQAARVLAQMRRGGHLHQVQMTLLPVTLPCEAENFMLVSFAEPVSAQAQAVPELDLGPEEKSAGRLEQELRQAREELQISIEQMESTNEELEASNEEIMSINEELQSANEELESSKAELQSLNEELTTVNHQLQEKINEVESANNDLSNLLTSTHIPTLFLDTKLRIRRYTSAALSLFHLIPSDVGRPISDIRHQFAAENLVADAHNVLEHLRPAEREIRSLGGEWYLRRIHPYCVGERSFEGVVVTCTDITDLKRAQEEIGHQASFPILNPNPVLELDLSGNLVFCNQAALNVVQHRSLPDARAFIPNDIDRILADAEQGLAEIHRRETAIGGRIFSETVQVVPQFKTVRIYALDVTDAKRAEQALFESEQRFRSVLENSQDIIYRVNLQTGLFEYVSPSSTALLGLVSGKLVGQSIQEVQARHLHPEDLRVISGRMATLIQAGSGRLEYRWLVKNNEYRWLSSQITVVRDDAGRPLYRDGIIRDITKSKQVEADLREARDYLENLLNYANAPIICWDSDFNITRFNHAFERMTGYAAKEVIGRHLSLLFPENTKQESLGKIKDALSGERWEGEEIPILRRDSAVRIALWNSANVYAEDGRTFQATIAQGQDITERKQAEALARKRTEHLQLLSEASLGLQKAADPTALVKELFQKVRRHLDVQMYFNFMVNESQDALVLDSYAGIPDDAARLLEHIDFGTAVCGTVALLRQPMLAVDIQHSDDEKVQLVKGFGVRAYFCHPLMAGDRLLGTLSFGSTTRDDFDENEQDFIRTICHYVSMAKERLRLISMLRRQNAQLAETGQRKDQFLAMLSHELRNPLAPISTTLELFRRHPAAADDKIAHWLGIFDRQLRYLTRIIDDLLDASRVSRGLIALQKQPVSLREAAGQALENNRELIEGRAQTFALTLADADLILDADPVRLVQILSNLINNASKYTPAGGRISLSARPKGGQAVIEITDTGIGIAAADLSHVFDAFFQADKSLDRPHSGLGLGLNLVEQMTALHGGEIAIDSQGENKGTRVSLSLPLSADPVAAETAGCPDAGQASPVRKLKILIADDNVDFAESLAEVLEGWGHEIFIRHSGTEALQAASEIRPQVVLLDIGLPGLDGFEVARRLRSLPGFSHTVLAALTGYGQPEDRKRSEEAGFDFHFTKPFDIPRMEKLFQELAARPED